MATVDRLEVQIQASASRANAQLDLLVSRLGNVANTLNSINSGGLTQLASGVDAFCRASAQLSNVKTADFTRLVKNISALANINSGQLNLASSSLTSIANSMNGLSAVSDNSIKVAQVARDISKLGGANVTKAITNLPLLSVEMNKFMTTMSTAPQVSSNLISMTNALANLASQGSKIGSATSTINTNLRSFGSTASYATNKTISLTSAIGKFYAKFFLLIRAFKLLKGAVGYSMDFLETVNYFEVAMNQIGSTASENWKEAGYISAEAYANSFSERTKQLTEKMTGYSVDEGGNTTITGEVSLGMNPNEVMQYQATFAQVANSIGVCEEASIDFSKALTMLGADWASLKNINFDSAWEKMASAITGQSRAVRSLGIDITNATLQEVAYSYGLEQKVSEMNQATKAQLRLLTILEQSKVAYGDLANTMSSPNNQMRLMQQNLSNLGRTIGNLFLPVIQKILPYLNGFIIALQRVFAIIGADMGVDFSSINTSVGSASDSVNDLIDNVDDTSAGLDDATDSAKKLRSALSSFDELNVINRGSSSDTGTSTSVSGGSPALDSAIDSSLSEYEKAWNKAFEQMDNDAQKIADEIQPKIENFITTFDKFKPALAGVAGAFATYKLAGLFTTLGSTIGALATSPAGPIALIIGILGGLAYAIKTTYDEMVKNDMNARFGDLKLSMEEAEKVAKRIVDNGTLDLVAKASLEWDDLSSIETDIDKEIDTLNLLNWKVNVGLTLTKEEEEEYKKTISEFTTSVQSYVDNHKEAALLSISLLVDGDGKKNITKSTSEFYSSIQGELATLGQDLQNTVNTAWEDGLLEIDEVKEITEIQEQMANIQKKLSQSESTAKFEQLDIKFGTVLDKSSFDRLQTEIDNILKENSEDWEDIELNLLANASLKLNEGAIDDTEYKQEIETIKESRLSNIGEITLKATEFSLGTIYTAFQTELENASPGFTEEFQNEMDKWFSYIGEGGDFEGEWGRFFTEMSADMDSGYSGLSSVTKTNLKNLLDGMEPTKEQLETLANGYLEAGLEVPQSINDALTDIYMLEAMTGNIDSMWGIVGKSVAESPELTQALKNAEKSGVNIPKKLLSSMNNEIKENKDSMNKSGEKIVKNVTKGVTSKLLTDRSTAAEYMKGYLKVGLINPATSKLDIKSGSSKLFENYGLNVVDGLNNGISNNQTKSEGIVQGWADKLSGWFTEKLGIHSPSRLFGEYGMYTVQGFNTGLQQNMDTSYTKVSEWADGISTNFQANTKDMAKEIEDINLPRYASDINAKYSVTSDIEEKIYTAVASAMSNMDASVLVKVEADKSGMIKVLQQEDNTKFKSTGKGLFVH